eukprot:4322060-Prymnesium_polylepis.1
MVPVTASAVLRRGMRSVVQSQAPPSSRAAILCPVLRDVQSQEPPSSRAAILCPVLRDVGGWAWPWGASAAAPAWRVTR